MNSVGFQNGFETVMKTMDNWRLELKEEAGAL